VKKVDYGYSGDLAAALIGQDVLVITMNARAPGDPQAKLIAAAAEAGVKWIIPNECGYDHTNEKLKGEDVLGTRLADTREQIDRLGRSRWIAVLCGFWYEWSLGGGAACYGFDFKNREVVFFDDARTVVNTTTWPQVGRAVAALLSLPVEPARGARDKSACLSRWAGDSVKISSFRVSQRDMLDSVLRVTGTGIGDWKIRNEGSVERYHRGVEMMKKGEFVGFAQAMYTRVFYQDGVGDFETSQGLQNEMLGLPKEDLDEFTKIALERGKDGGFA